MKATLSWDISTSGISYIIVDSEQKKDEIRFHPDHMQVEADSTVGRHKRNNVLQGQ